MKLLTAFLALAALSLPALKAATVTTQLSADEVPLGSVVQMQVRVDGSTNVVPPQSLGVDGLESALTGRGTQISIINGRMTSSGVYTYTIRPRREGTFEIPALEINVDGHKEKTAPQRLAVTAGTAPPQPYLPPAPAPPSGGANPKSLNGDAKGKRAFARLIIPKKSIYVGEVVPVEVQLYFSCPFKPERDPQVTGEGFTAQALGQPTHSQAEADGVRYDVYTFKTSITAVKSGELKTPVASIAGILSIPLDEGSGEQSLFGAMMGLVENHEITIESDSEPIRVKALPAQGRPANFSGAVGDFTIAATAQPEKVAAGDPVTLKVVVSGRGNFDAMGDPQLVDDEGWRPYPPTSKFEKSDEIGYGGRKIFEMPMVAQRPQTKTPVAEFSYFDPDKGKYFIISSQPVAVEAAAAPSAEPSATAAPEAQPSAAPKSEQGDQWITAEKKRSWQPVLRWQGFWILNAAAAIVLASVVVGSLVRRHRAGPAGQRAALVRQRDHLVSELGQDSLADEVFCAKALDALTLQARVSGKGGPFEFVRSLEAEGRAADNLNLVLGRADEIKFSGGNLASRLDAAERHRIAQAVKEACR